MNKYTSTLDYLYSLQKFGMKFGLENIKYLLDYLGNPHEKFKSIHVAGTNGKGSTSSLIASLICEMGYKVGLYTSPHLVHFNERIKINGEEIENDFIIEQTNVLRSIIEKIKPTFFEVTTAIAFKYFESQKVDYAVIETGLGGRLDSTNIIQPICTVITRIDFDHREILGVSLDKIAHEKGGIIKEKIPVIISKNVEEVKNVIKNITLQKSSLLIDAEKTMFASNITSSFDSLSFILHSTITKNYYFINSPLIGEFQIENIKTAVACIEACFNNIVKVEHVENGIKNLKFKIKGRFQIFKTSPIIILDTAHNSNAIDTFLSELLKNENSKIAILGIMKDKQIDEIISKIENTFYKIILTQAKTERSLAVDILANKFNIKEKIFISKNVHQAIDMAFSISSKDELIVIFGSNYIVGEAIEYLESKGYEI